MKINIDLEENTEGLDYYLVGGAVRDIVMGNEEPKDLDFVVVGETEESMVDRGFRFIPSSSAYPVFLDSEGREFALARREELDEEETKDEDEYVGKFNFKTDEVTLEEDLERRDFRMNAMAMDSDGNIIDPFNGKDDIENEVIHHVSDAFREDPLRILRLARFSARLEFDPHPDTIEISREVAPKLEHIPESRIGRGIQKAMKEAENPSKFFRVLRECNALEHISEELAMLADDELPAGPEEYHQEDSAWEHTMLVVDSMKEIAGNDVGRLLCALFHDIGKINTSEDILPSHYGHDKEGAEIMDTIGYRDFKFSKEINRKLKLACEQHMRVKDIPEMYEAGNYSKIIRLVDKLDSGNDLNSEELLDLAIADDMGSIDGKGVTFPREKIERIFEEARQVMEEIDGEYVLDNFDVENETIGDVLEQERVKEMKKLN